jgi:hypothetical protein
MITIYLTGLGISLLGWYSTHQWMKCKNILDKRKELQIAYKTFGENALKNNVEFDKYWPEEARELNSADCCYISKHKNMMHICMVNGLICHLIVTKTQPTENKCEPIIDMEEQMRIWGEEDKNLNK